MFSLEILPVVGLPQAKGWSQVVTNIHDELIVTFAISGPNANDHGRDIAEIWRKATPKSAANLHQLLLDVIRRVHRVGCEVFFAAGLFLDDSTATEIPTVFATYNGSILMRKNGKMGQLLNSQGELKVLEGTAQNEMVVVLSTQAAHTFAGEISQKLQQGFEVGTIVTSLIPGIHGLPDSSLYSCSFLVCQIPEPLTAQKSNQATDKETAAFPQPTPNQLTLSAALTESNLAAPQAAAEGPIMELSPAVQSAVKSSAIHTNSSPHFIDQRLPANAWLRRGMRLVKKTATWIKKLIFQAPKKMNIWAPRLMMVGLIIGLSWAGQRWQQQEIAQDLASLEQKLQPLIDRSTQAEQSMVNSPVQSRQDISAVAQELDELAKTYNQAAAPLKKRIKQEQEKIKATGERLSGMTEIPELSTFFDLRLVDTEFVATTADAKGENVFFLDTGKNQVIRLNLEKKESEMVQIGDQQNLKDLAVTDRYLYLLGNGVLKYKLGGQEPATPVPSKADDPATTGEFLKQFGAFLYVFNADMRNIYRYNQSESSDSPIGWLISKKDLDFSQVRSLAIDGDVWLGTKTGEIKKFTQGKQQPFAIRGLQTLPTSAVIVYTTDELDQLYVLEPDQQRLLVLKKDGEFVRQIKSKTLGSATGLVISESSQKAYALSGSVVYEIEIQ